MTAANRLLLVRAVISSALTVVLSATLILSAAPSAHATPKRAKTISRERVLERARSWVKKRVPYSQYSYHRGYRQDCSGFVSMAWKTGTSYSTRSLHQVSRRISWRKVRPGDAVVTPGHAVVFAKWKNRKKRTFYAYEETTWGGHAERKVRTLTGNAKVLRRDGIRNAGKKPRVVRAPREQVKQLSQTPAIEPLWRVKARVRHSSESVGTVAAFGSLGS